MKSFKPALRQIAVGAVLAVCVVAPGLFVACSTVERTIYDEQVVPASTNAQTGEITPARTNLAANPNVETGIAVIGAVPTPYTVIGSAAAAILYGAYMTWRNSRKNKTNVAMVKGIEEYKVAEKLSDAEVEKLNAILKDKQEAAGVRPEVTKILERIRK